MSPCNVVKSSCGLVFVALMLSGCTDSGARGSSSFINNCNSSIRATTDWAASEVALKGKEISFLQRVAVDVRMKSVCACVETELGADVSPQTMPFAGRLVGYDLKVVIAMGTRDRQLRERMSVALGDELQDLMAKYDSSTGETGQLMKKLKDALKVCRRRA